MRVSRVGRSALVACALLGAMAPPAAGQADFDRRIQAAAQKLTAGDALGAFLELETILAQDDTLWAAYFHLGRAQVQMGDDLGARASFLRAAELNPGNADLHFLIATAALQLGDFDTGWAQAIAAHQAGYDPLVIEGLIKQMEPYSPAPPDLQARLDAPKVAVVPDDATDEVLEALAQQLRTELFHAALVAVVQDVAKARHRVELSRPEPGRLLLLAVEVATARELGRREVTLPDSGPDSGTDLALSAFVTALEGWLRE